MADEENVWRNPSLPLDEAIERIHEEIVARGAPSGLAVEKDVGDNVDIPGYGQLFWDGKGWFSPLFGYVEPEVVTWCEKALAKKKEGQPIEKGKVENPFLEDLPVPGDGSFP